MAEIRRCDVSLTASGIPADLSHSAVVVIDVLRATTTIAYALQNGARGVIPCEEPADAIAVREQLGGDGVLLAGERDSVRIPGFDLDNSPLSCVAGIVRDKTLAFTTTNGTRALRRAMDSAAPVVLCGAFVNLDPLVERVQRCGAANVLLACAGDEGEVALEDLLLAGAVAARLAGDEHVVECTDLARAAILAYRSAAGELEKAIATSKHARALIRAGFSKDITVAAQINSAPVVPVLANERLIVSRVE